MKTVFYALVMIYSSAVGGHSPNDVVYLKNHLTESVCLDESRKITLATKSHQARIYCIVEKP